MGRGAFLGSGEGEGGQKCFCCYCMYVCVFKLICSGLQICQSIHVINMDGQTEYCFFKNKL